MLAFSTEKGSLLMLIQKSLYNFIEDTSGFSSYTSSVGLKLSAEASDNI